jgi:putative hemolysin
MRKLHRLYQRVSSSPNDKFIENLLQEMDVTYRVTDCDLARVPARGPAIAVANHPFGILDGLIAAALLRRVRPDLKVLTNSHISGVPALEDLCILVDPYRLGSAVNRRAAAQAASWLGHGGMLLVFPAGEVAGLNLRSRKIEERPWSQSPARLSKIAGAPVVPVYFAGRNSLSFHALGLLHPDPIMRTATLVHEFLGALGKSVEVRVGSAVAASELSEMSAEEATRYLRWRTHLLAARNRSRSRKIFIPLPAKPTPAPKPVAAPVPQQDLAREVAALGPERIFSEDRNLSVFVAQGSEIPHVLRELGRLREQTFRAAGEGTGREIDLDPFDLHYSHLFVWNGQKQEVVGAYRMADVRTVLAERGIDGLYTSTLFRYDAPLFEHLGNGLELGRAFLRAEYQRQYAPLLLLWKAIASFVASRPDSALLFGAVSISAQYSMACREMLVRYCETHLPSPLSRYVHPRNPFRVGRRSSCGLERFERIAGSLESLSGPIQDVEADNKAVPILLRQYVKLGGQLLGFNVDRSFSDCVDGLMLIDLRKTEPQILERYMGTEKTREFRRHHGMNTAPRS